MRDYSNLITALRINEDLFNQRDAVGIATLYRDAADAIEELLAEKAKIENSGKLFAAAFERLKEKAPHRVPRPAPPKEET